MKELSEAAKLSMIYTNYSMHATCITNLDQAGFESRHIMAVSSHKSESTVKTYACQCPENKKQEMSMSLAQKISRKATKLEQTAMFVLPSNPEETPEKPLLHFNPESQELMPLPDELDDQIFSNFLDATE